MEDTIAQHVHKDMKIGEVVQKYPQAAEVFTKYGLHCVGCHISPLETVEQGAFGHGMDQETLNKMIDDANKAVIEGPKDVKTASVSEEDFDIVFTDLAVEKVKEFAKKEKKEGEFFRVGVMPGGCSGFSYTLNFEEKKGEDDVELEKNGLTIVVDKAALDLLNGVNIDFVETLQDSGFKIENPNAQKTCGCGSSFG